MQAFRAALLRFADDRSAVYDEDGLLVVGPDAAGRQVVRAVGDYATLAPNYPGVAVEHLPGRIIAPGFIDLHIHFPQTDVIGSPAEGLLPWLENYTFPHEARFDIVVRRGRPTASDSAEHAVRWPRVLEDGLGRGRVKNPRPVEPIDLDEDGAGFLSAAPAHGGKDPLDITSTKVSRDPDAGFQPHQLQ